MPQATYAQTPKALWRRIRKDGAGDLKKILQRWPSEGFFIPPKNKQVANAHRSWQLVPEDIQASGEPLQGDRQIDRLQQQYHVQNPSAPHHNHFIGTRSGNSGNLRPLISSLLS